MKLLALMAVEFLAFLLATLNFRYCAKGHMAKTLATDLLIAANGFFVVKLVADAQTPWELAAYVIGAGLGSLAGMRLTRGVEDRG